LRRAGARGDAGGTAGCHQAGVHGSPRRAGCALPGRAAVASDGYGDDRPRSRGGDGRHRRAVRGDEGAAGRLLPDRRRLGRRGEGGARKGPVATIGPVRGAPNRPGPVGGAGRIATPPDPELGKVFREEHGRVLATLISVLGAFAPAEAALQDAVAEALERWP